MHHFPPFQPNPKGLSTTSISVDAPATPPPSPPYRLPSPSSPSPPSWRAAAAAARDPPPPRPRRRETPAEKDPGFARPMARALVPTLAEIEEEVRSYGREAAAAAAAERPRLRPAKRIRRPAPVEAVALPPPSPPPSQPSSTGGGDREASPLTRRVAPSRGEPAPLLRPALRTPSSSFSSKPRKTVRFAAAAPDTQFFASWDAPSRLKLLRRTPGRAVPGPDGGAPPRHHDNGSLPPSPPPAWHWQLRTPGLPTTTATASSASSSSPPPPPPPVVQLRDLFLGARRRPSTVLGLVSVARAEDTSTTTATKTASRRRPAPPPGAVVCEGTRDGGRTWAAAGAGTGCWFCSAPRCDWFQFSLDAAGLGLLGNNGDDDDGGTASGQEKAEATAASDLNPHNTNKNPLALRVRYRDEAGRQWVDDNHGAGFEVGFELCWAGGAAGPVDDDDWETAPEEELGWNE